MRVGFASLLFALLLCCLPARAQDILAVAPELRQALQAQGIDRHSAPQRRMEALADFLLSPDHLGIEYDNRRTLELEQVYRQRRANCVSFAQLYATLERELGLDAWVHESPRVIEWSQEQGVAYMAGHVNVGVRIGRRRFTVDIDRSIVPSSQPERIDDARALAHFHNNRGAELLAEGRTADARAEFAVASRLQPDFVAALSNLALLEMTDGRLQEAEAALMRALAFKPRDVPTLLNLLRVLQQSGQTSKVARFRSRLLEAQARNPYEQARLGLLAEQAGDWPQALAHYRRATRLKNGEHGFHFALARVLMAMGDRKGSERELRRAEGFAAGAERDRYRGKLERMRALASHS